MLDRFDSLIFWFLGVVSVLGILGLVAQAHHTPLSAEIVALCVTVAVLAVIGGLRRVRGTVSHKQREINRLLFRDHLTGVANRRALEAFLLGDGVTPFTGAVVFIDLDGFKRVNDTLGHEAGDVVIRTAAQKITEALANQRVKNSMIARYAGDEFVIALPGMTDPPSVLTLCHQILGDLAQPVSVDGQPVAITASVGVARTPIDTCDLGLLIAFADAAMYDAKRGGKNRVALFSHQSRELLIEQNRLESEIGTALNEGQLTLHYQPKIHAQSFEVVGVEALVRWNHPRIGVLGPVGFIDLAEKSGMMIKLGQSVLAMAVTQAKAWQKRGMNVPVAVNVSPTQFQDPAFVSQLVNTIQEHHLPAHLLQIEITESVAMGDFSMASNKIAELSLAGIRVSIDDFGIGHSNLNQLIKPSIRRDKGRHVSSGLHRWQRKG